jgi:hypothetical protein
MTTLKGYNPITMQWEPVATGIPGPKGAKGDKGDPAVTIPIPYDDWPPEDPQPNTLYLRLAT